MHYKLLLYLHFRSLLSLSALVFLESWLKSNIDRKILKHCIMTIMFTGPVEMRNSLIMPFELKTEYHNRPMANLGKADTKDQKLS